MKDELCAKYEALKQELHRLGSLAVGFSGGVDSSFLLAVAQEELGERALAITQDDASVPRREIEESKAFCQKYRIRQIFCHADPCQFEEYRNNTAMRCYVCKRAIFREILRIAKENHIDYVAEGSNTDDMQDYRPGMKAIEELSVTSPLRTAGLSKKEIRLLSKEMGLETWDKPSYACLASRLAYGEEITEEKLLRLDRAEQFLIDLGFLEERVRMHGNLARIELPAADIERFATPVMRRQICEEFKRLGFLYITLDLEGYRSGSMNAALQGIL